MNMLTLLYFVTSKQPKNKGYPQNPIKLEATTTTTHQEYPSQDAPTLRSTLFLQTVKIYVSVPPVTLWSCLHQKNTTSFSDLQRLLDLNMKIHFKTTRREWLRIPSRTNLRRYRSIFLPFTVSPPWPQVLSTIHGFSTLAANNKPKKKSIKKTNFDQQV